MRRARGTGCKLKCKTFCLNISLFYCEGDKTPEYFVQRGCSASVLVDTQNPTEHSPEQSAVGDPTRAGQPDCQPQLIADAGTLLQQRTGSFKKLHCSNIFCKFDIASLEMGSHKVSIFWAC